MKYFQIKVAVAFSIFAVTTVNVLAIHKESVEARNFGAKAKLTICASSEEGIEVSNYSYEICFWRTDNTSDINIIDGKADCNGKFVCEGITNGKIGYSLKKSDYYQTWGEYSFYRSGFECVKDGKWIPWNKEISLVLKRKLNPIPMFVKRVYEEIPKASSRIGYDLEVGDWVAPFGEGKVCDLILKFDSEKISHIEFKHSLEITFSSPNDGIQELPIDENSKLKSKYLAPEVGYIDKLTFSTEVGKRKISEKKLIDNNYLVFRVRTVTDKNGNIISANYGKIYSPFRVSRNGKLYFQYYYNPEKHSRNIEFDLTKNLFEKDSENIYPAP